MPRGAISLNPLLSSGLGLGCARCTAAVMSSGEDGRGLDCGRLAPSGGAKEVRHASSAAMADLSPTSSFRSHFLPRTGAGRVAVVVYVGLFVLAMPPVTHALLDRPDQWVGGVPFFFVSLFVIYTSLIGVLVWAHRKRI